MNIPIFNRRATRNNIRSAQLSARSQRLALTEAELALRKEIEQAWYNADAAYSKYRSAGVALASAEVAFAYEQQKAESGRSTIFDFQRCQDPHGKSRVGTRSGEIRIRIPFENTGFLPRETAETVIRAGKQIVHNKQIGRPISTALMLSGTTNP